MLHTPFATLLMLRKPGYFFSHGISAHIRLLSLLFSLLGTAAFATPGVSAADTPAIAFYTDRKFNRMRPSMSRVWGHETRLALAI